MTTWRKLGLCLTSALVCLFAQTGSAAPEWHVVKVGRWDYLTIDNIAEFYGFARDVTPINRTILLDNGRNQLQVTLDSREAIVNGVRNWLCFPVLQGHDGKYLVSRIDLAKTIEPQFRPHMIRNLGKLRTVVIDPGHGGVENGASSSYGNEKAFTLDVALKLRTLLQAKGLQVIMTREKDQLVPLPERARIANATRDSVFVSIHFNAADVNGDASGFEIYSLTPRGAPSTQDNSMLERFINMQAGSPVDAPSLALSMSVYHAMLGYMPEFDRGIKRARFAVLRLTNIPAILVEGGFLTEREESRLIARPEWREKLAEAISVGIDNYRGLVDRKQRPMLLADYRRQLEGVLVARNADTPASATPPVFAATNRIAPAPNAQITAAVHEEPSEPMDLSESPVVAASPATGTPPAAIVNDLNANAPAVAAVVEEPAPSPEENAGMPAADEPAASAPNETKMVAATAPTPSPAPVQVRKYWVLKIPPMPHFRE